MDLKIVYKDHKIETYHKIANFKIGVNWIHFDSAEGYQSIPKNEMADYVYLEEKLDELGQESNQFLYAVMLVVVVILLSIIHFIY